ncbi:hypothetical protein QQX98_011865 [Neonectria punicea]|uniref:Uncharacterized protein n=1 Tax=Neonectria punicea TaxID=979145 RepID=A0ABR1GKS1_9HYPO
MEVPPSADQVKASTTGPVADEEIITDAHRMVMADRTLTALLMLLAQAPRRLELQASGWGCHHLLLLHTTTTTARLKMATIASQPITRGVRASLHRCMVRLDSTRDLAGIKATGITGTTTEEEEIAGENGQ